MNGDECTEILKEEMRAVYRYLMKTGASHSDAEDVVQDTLYKAVLYMEAIAPESFRAWLFKVAHNGYLDLCRQRKGHPEVTLDSAWPADRRTPEEAALNRVRQEEVSAVLAKMKPVYRRLILLKYQSGLSIREIACALSMGEETVKKYLYRARIQFREHYRRGCQ